jgi:hypothetical protein
MEKKNSPKLNTIKEEPSTPTHEPKQVITQPQLTSQNKTVHVQPETQVNTHEVTGNSFFNDVTLNMKKKDPIRQPGLISNSTTMIKKKTPQEINKVSEVVNDTKTNQGFNIYQMEQAKPNPEAPVPVKNPQPANPNESLLGTKINRQNVNNDLNCTLNDESIAEYFVDEQGYLVTEKGQLMYDDNGNVVKLTEEQIKEFKDNELYEEVEK